MKVTLLSFTPDALTLLLRTKNTRLANDSDPAHWSEEKRQEHLDYMRDTIKSSWEFVDYTFEISGVTRAFTHQLVRTRTGAYAQESQRTVDVSDHEIVEPDFSENIDAEDVWQAAADKSMMAYQSMLALGIPAQDARGILPTNVTTSIIAKFNLRTLSEMAKIRLCTRTQGEHQDVFRKMRHLVVGAHPWALQFLDVHCAATGTCAFPRYGKTSCPIYKHCVPQEVLETFKDAARLAADIERHVAVPVAKDGRTM